MVGALCKKVKSEKWKVKIRILGTKAGILDAGI